MKTMAPGTSVMALIALYSLPIVTVGVAAWQQSLLVTLLAPLLWGAALWGIFAGPAYGFLQNFRRDYEGTFVPASKISRTFRARASTVIGFCTYARFF